MGEGEEETDGDDDGKNEDKNGEGDKEDTGSTGFPYPCRSSATGFGKTMPCIGIISLNASLKSSSLHPPPESRTPRISSRVLPLAVSPRIYPKSSCVIINLKPKSKNKAKTLLLRDSARRHCLPDQRILF